MAGLAASGSIGAGVCLLGHEDESSRPSSGASLAAKSHSESHLNWPNLIVAAGLHMRSGAAHEAQHPTSHSSVHQSPTQDPAETDKTVVNRHVQRSLTHSRGLRHGAEGGA